MAYARQRLAVLASSLLASACAGGQTGSEGSMSMTSGICAGPTLDACSADADCERNASAMLAPFQASAVSAPRRLLAADCRADEACDPDAICSCAVALGDGEARPLLVGGLLGGQPERDCALYGRSLACLWPAPELTDCRPGTCDCADICRRAIALLDGDDARAPQVQTRMAQCVQGTCRYALAIDDRCYAGTPIVQHEVDCASSDEQLMRLAEQNAFTTGACHDVIQCVDPPPHPTPDPDLARCSELSDPSRTTAR